MLDLLKWRTHPDKITGCLSKLKEIDGSEIVKVNASCYSSLRNLWDKEYLEGKDRGYFIYAFTSLSNSFCKIHWIPYLEF